MVLSGPFPHFLTENNSVEETESTKNMVVVFLPEVIYSYQAQNLKRSAPIFTHFYNFSRVTVILKISAILLKYPTFEAPINLVVI